MRLYEITETTDQFTFDGVPFTRTAQGWVAQGKLHATGSAEAKYLDAVASTVANGGSTTSQQQAGKRTALLNPTGKLAGDLPAYNVNADRASRVVEPKQPDDYKGDIRNPNYYKKWQYNWGKPQVT